MAVEIGGTNHRFGLYDMMMIKDNHIDFAGGINKQLKEQLTTKKVMNYHLKLKWKQET